MKREFSIYLDLVRLLAALMVVIYHSNVRMVIAEKLPLSNHGHAAVIVFFVLSGYVISHITATRERAPLDYWASRLSRLYSLALPAVLLSPLLDLAGEALAPQFYAEATTYNLGWLRILSSLCFLNEIWSVSIMSFSNVPYWSLCYEMWYYILFAIVTFTRGRKRLLLAGAAMLLLGPKILLLAPIWVLGVVLQRAACLQRLSEAQGWALFLLSWPLYYLFQDAGLSEAGSGLLRDWIGAERHAELTFSKFFIGDYPLALIIAANFTGCRAIAHRFAPLLLPCEKLIRTLSAYTFALYILHQPLLQFFAAVFNGDPRGRLFYAEVMAATLLAIAVVGTVIERRRPHLRRLLRRLLGTLAAALGRRPDAQPQREGG